MENKINLLCVDDSTTFRTLLTLSFVGWERAKHVKVLADSKQAVMDLLEARTSGEPYDVIILDIEMGPPNGIDLAKQIKMISTYRLTPIYFLTSTQDSELLSEAAELGEVVQKNRRVGDELLEVITAKFKF